MNKIEKHKELLDYLHKLYIEKNHDYGDSVHDTYVKYGITSFLVRMEDKLNRARTLTRNAALVNNEKIEDTLLDLANYAILAVLELQEEKYSNNLEKGTVIGWQTKRPDAPSGYIATVKKVMSNGDIII